MQLFSECPGCSKTLSDKAWDRLGAFLQEKHKLNTESHLCRALDSLTTS